MNAQDAYLGWTEMQHREDCARPAWVVDTRSEYDVVRPRDRDSTATHSCPDEECGHGPRMERTTVRIVCVSCGRAYVVTSESAPLRTYTEYLGYGQKPLKPTGCGLLLWPGEPLLPAARGRMVDPLRPGPGRRRIDAAAEPYDYLVTAPGVTRPTQADLVGEIGQEVTPRGAVRYSAVAVQDPAGQYGYRLRWAVGADGFKSPTAAAKWIAGQLAGRAADRPAEVTG